MDIANGTPTVYNREIIDQETYKLELRLRLYQELILFNIIDIRGSNIILEFLWLKTINPLIFWAQQIVVFPEVLNKEIFF